VGCGASPRQAQEVLQRAPHLGDLYVFRGRSGSLVKILWRDGVGLSLHAKRLERRRFIWPSATGGAVSISASQLAYMLVGIDWIPRKLGGQPQPDRLRRIDSGDGFYPANHGHVLQCCTWSTRRIKFPTTRMR
jgi:transposase